VGNASALFGRNQFRTVVS